MYEKEVQNVFQGLDRVEAILKANAEKKLKTESSISNSSNSKNSLYLVGDQLTEADVRLYPTIVRFDPVYVQHFKTNLTTIRDGYPYIHLWLRNLYWNYPAFKETTNFNHIKWHYTRSHGKINPLGLTPLGPSPCVLPLPE